MPTLAPGNHASGLARRQAKHRSDHQGFTLLELLVVVSIVALATAGVSLSLRDGSASQLEREAQRLTALLDSARSASRTLGVPVYWQPGPKGFELNGQFRAWLAPGTQVIRPPGNGTTEPPDPLRIALGPEPLMSPQRLGLSLNGRTLWLESDGLRPFSVGAEPTTTGANPTRPSPP